MRRTFEAKPCADDEKLRRRCRSGYAIDTSGGHRKTLVNFTSDNGGERFSYLWPFSGQKGDLLEGGIRVPAIVRWPGVVPANRITQRMAITMDWTATIVASAKSDASAGHSFDGIDLLPVIKGTSRVIDRTFFWRIYARDAVRDGKWKYVRDGEVRRLFDLSQINVSKRILVASIPRSCSD